jgi:AAA family ATP:ADP antiporter
MAFIPLSIPMQRKAKAVIDGIASRLGKSGGSLIYQVLLLTCTSLATATPYVVVVTLLITVLWVYAVVVLSRELKVTIDDTLHDDESVRSSSAERA